MSYFEKFPLLVYEFNSKSVVVRDILCRASFLSEHKPLTDLYTKYNILDGETPQSLALKFYGSTFYHWVILFNEIHDPHFDWPMDIVNLESVCIDKYGQDTMYMTKHWVRDDIVIGEIKEFVKGIPWIPPENPGLATAVSFYDYEQELNDTRRIISIMRPELLGDFVNQFTEAVNV